MKILKNSEQQFKECEDYLKLILRTSHERIFGIEGIMHVDDDPAKEVVVLMKMAWFSDLGFRMKQLKMINKQMQ